MSALTCSACGASNAAELVYCASCGALLPRTTDPASGSAAAALAKRRSLGIETAPSSPGLLSRIKGLLIYLFWVAAGVIVVLVFMKPKEHAPQEQRVADAGNVVQRILTASRYAPAALSQPLINSLLAQQPPFVPESPIRLLPMPVWDRARVELSQGTLTLHMTVSMLGRSLRLSETFRLAGGPGSWSLEPQSATVGLLDLPGIMVPAILPVIRPGISRFAEDLAALSTARSLVIRSGLIEVTTR